MSEVAQYLLNFGVAGVILLSIGYFVDRRLWPWFTKEYWPSRQKTTEHFTEAIHQLTRTVDALRLMAESEASERASTVSLLSSISTAQERLLGQFETIVSYSRMLEKLVEYLDPARHITRPVPMPPQNMASSVQEDPTRRRYSPQEEVRASFETPTPAPTKMTFVSQDTIDTSQITPESEVYSENDLPR